MGRSYMVEEAVEKYLAQLVGGASATGLIIGQSSSLREFVVMAARTPEREGGGRQSQRKGSSSLNQQDVEWVSEHARQVSRMLPGGLCVVGVFLITPPDQAKEAPNTLRQIVFAVEKRIAAGQLWDLSEDDITDRVILHVCSKTRKTVCRTFDVKDPKSSAKPADWRYQSGVCSSWPIVSCSIGLELLVPLPENRTSTQDTERCIKKGLLTWAHQIQSGVCLLNGRHLSDDTELQGAQVE
ncbi:protein odr-4 homolog [Aplochiton taeniatus]